MCKYAVIGMLELKSIETDDYSLEPWNNKGCIIMREGHWRQGYLPSNTELLAPCDDSCASASETLDDALWAATWRCCFLASTSGCNMHSRASGWDDSGGSNIYSGQYRGVSLSANTALLGANTS